MKKLVIVIISFICILTISCEGPSGPPGPEGGLIVAPAFEIEIDFTSGNDYEYIEPYGFTIYPSDVTLVYILWDVIDGQEIWRLVPQTVAFNEGTLVYNYDFTREDVRFFLDGTIDFGLLDSVWTQNQVFRVVIVPADDVGKHIYTDLEAVMNVFNIKEFKKH
ncbi:hypothetical protein [Hanstruepera ponticola]|uniref:hypothetical protein n=1 Tax=Hanstruepera ponticola TaxID=2042995 RepID=UPI000CF0DAEC|nr:hypothetical protein [Hanstruepera ponticola]